MLNIFTNSNYGKDTQYTIKKYSRFDYIKRRYLDELARVREYYYNRIRAVDNTHPFSKIINNLSPSIELNNLEYYKIVSADAIYIARQYGITSNINQGRPFTNLFFKDNSTEFLLYTEKSIDPYDMVQDWKNIDCARVIYSENTDIDFAIPNGTKSLPYPQYTVIEIDVVTMLLQYKIWANERLKTDDSINPNVFVATIVLPNMLPNLLDLTIFNRFICISNNIEIPEFSLNHPFNVIDLSTGVDAVLTEVSVSLIHENVYIEQILLTIPTIYNANMIEALHIYAPYYSSRDEWLIWIARIPYIKFILSFLSERGIARNREDVYYLPTQIRRLANRASLVTLPPELNGTYLRTLYEISDKLGKR